MEEVRAVAPTLTTFALAARKAAPRGVRAVAEGLTAVRAVSFSFCRKGAVLDTRGSFRRAKGLGCIDADFGDPGVVFSVLREF